MSNFKKKINIIESATPPTNRNDWWYNTNDNNLYRYTTGWEAINKNEDGEEQQPLIINLADLAYDYVMWLEDEYNHEGPKESFVVINSYMEENYPTLSKFWGHAQKTWASQVPTEPIYLLVNKTIIDSALNYTDFTGNFSSDFTVSDSLWEDSAIPTQCIELTLTASGEVINDDPNIPIALKYKGDIYTEEEGNTHILIGAGCADLWLDGADLNGGRWYNAVAPYYFSSEEQTDWKKEYGHKSIDIEIVK